MHERLRRFGRPLTGSDRFAARSPGTGVATRRECFGCDAVVASSSPGRRRHGQSGYWTTRSVSACSRSDRAVAGAGMSHEARSAPANATRAGGGEQQRPLFVLFGTNLALNLAWTLIFFRGRSPLAAGVEIVALEGATVALVVRAWPLSRLAALLLVPYAIWIGFATALTWAIWARN